MMYIYYFQINEDVVLGKCSPVYHRSPPVEDEQPKSEDTRAAMGE